MWGGSMWDIQNMGEYVTMWKNSSFHSTYWCRWAFGCHHTARLLAEIMIYIEVTYFFWEFGRHTYCRMCNWELIWCVLGEDFLLRWQKVDHQEMVVGIGINTFLERLFANTGRYEIDIIPSDETYTDIEFILTITGIKWGVDYILFGQNHENE